MMTPRTILLPLVIVPLLTPLPLAMADVERGGNPGFFGGDNAFVGDPGFDRGTWTAQTYASSTISSDGGMTSLHAGVGYFVFNNISLNLEALGGPVNSETDNDGFAAGFDLLLRHHVLGNERASFYIDAGVGFQQANTDFPSDSHHNFRPQAGVGGQVRVHENWRLMGGVRWLHISNAGTSDINNGLDSLQYYAGVMLSF